MVGGGVNGIALAFHVVSTTDMIVPNKTATMLGETATGGARTTTKAKNSPIVCFPK